MKRAELELRGLHDAARAAAGEGAKFAPPEHARRIAAVDQRRAELGQALAARQKAQEEAKAELRAKDAAVKDVSRRIADAHGARTTLQRQAAQQQGAQEQSLRAALIDRHDLGEQGLRRLLSERHPSLEVPELREEIRIHASQMRASELELAKHRQAVDAFDKPSVRRGAIMIAAAALVALVAFLLLTSIFHTKHGRKAGNELMPPLASPSGLRA